MTVSFSRRRTQFAMPFVVVTACADAPPAHHARHPKPPVACVAPTLPAPPATRPAELVDRLPPLVPRGAQTPPHRRERLEIHLVERDGDGSLVRFALGDQRTTLQWDVAITNADLERVGDCEIVAIGAYEIDCSTKLVPEAITGHTVACTPPAKLAAQMLEEDCRTGVATCNPPPPSPNTPCGWPGGKCDPPPRPAPVPACSTPPSSPDWDGTICNPPHPGWTAGRVLKSELQSDHLLVTISRGSNDGVKRNSKCRASGKPAPTCVVVQVWKSTTLVSMRATTDQVNAIETFDLETP